MKRHGPAACIQVHDQEVHSTRVVDFVSSGSIHGCLRGTPPVIINTQLKINESVNFSTEYARKEKFFDCDELRRRCEDL